MTALDLFAGVGWGVAAERLGLAEHGVEIMPEAVATRDAAGMVTVGRDVWDFVPAEQYEGLIASPPCQTFSMAGKGSGRKALDDVLTVLWQGRYKSRLALRDAGEQFGDDRTALVLTPLYFWHELRPDWVAWEQVPAVLPVWQACAEVMRAAGYSVWTGNLNAEQYGVPQTRKRAFLLARRNGPVAPPEPTHSRYYSRSPETLDTGLKKWVSMAEGLGWGMTERPYPTIACSRTTGGPDKEKVGGSAARRIIYAERDAGHWRELVRAEVEPRVNNQSGTAFDLSWPCDRPAPVIAGRELVTMPGANANRFNGATKSRNDGIKVELHEAGMLQSFPASFPWQGNKSKQFLQVGNAVPPLLAEAVLEAVQ